MPLLSLTSTALLVASSHLAPSDPPRLHIGDMEEDHLLAGSELAVYFGYHGIGEGVDSGELGFEFRIPPTILDLQFSLGYMATTDEAYMAYVGTRYQLKLGERVEFCPSAAVGYFEIGEGQDLGNDLMFRIGGEVTKRYGAVEVGLGVYHYSNSGTGYINPGLESVLLTVSYGF